MLSKNSSNIPASFNEKEKLNNNIEITQDEFIKIFNTLNSNNSKTNAEKLISLFQQLEKKTLSQTPDIITCIVQSHNPDGTINVHPIGENDDIVWTIQNQSIYKDIPIGSPVKVLKQDRNNNINMWIGAVNNAENKKDILYVVREDELEYLKNRINFLANQFSLLENLIMNMAYHAFGHCTTEVDESGSINVVYKKNINAEEIAINNYRSDKKKIVNNLKTPKNGTIAKGLFSTL